MWVLCQSALMYIYLFFITAGESRGYCYQNVNCQGPHVEATAEVTQSECNDMGGAAWGKHGDDTCHPCQTKSSILPGVIGKNFIYIPIIQNCIQKWLISKFGIFVSEKKNNN